MVSLHGGHSGDFCAHGEDTLREMLEAAVDAGLRTFGVSNHAPPADDRFLYDDQRERDQDAQWLDSQFDQYFVTLDALVPEFENRLNVLRSFEAEAAPADGFAQRALALRARHEFDYMVGSVHHVDDVPIDYTAELFAEAAERNNGEQGLTVRYYETVAEMVSALQPEVVGHLDLPRLLATDVNALSAPATLQAAAQALDAIRKADSILDVNTSGIRKGLGGPYVAPWLVSRANDLGIPFCFGDDSHAVQHVGSGIAEGRDYLLGLGVDRITVIERTAAGAGRREISLL